MEMLQLRPEMLQLRPDAAVAPDDQSFLLTHLLLHFEYKKPLSNLHFWRACQ
jgi:hypothetical protein